MEDKQFSKTPLFTSRAITSRYGLEDRLSSYLRLILEHNQKINLVSRETSFQDLIGIAADSLVPFEFLDAPSGRIFDIGPGAGFPSLVIALAFPGVECVLIERTKKKAAFLVRIVDLLGLAAEVIDADFVEASSRLQPSSFDYGFLKLVRPDRKLLHRALGLLTSSGRFIYFGGPERTGADFTGGLELERFDYYLDDCEQLRTITAISKRR